MNPGDRLREAAEKYRDEWLGYLDPEEQPLESGVFEIVVQLLKTAANYRDKGQHNRTTWYADKFAALVLPDAEREASDA